MKSYIRYIGIGFFLLSLIGTIYYLFEQKNKQIRSLKSEVLERDVIIEHEKGLYSKLVNDLNREKDLRKKVEGKNEELADIIKKHKEKVVQIVETVVQIPSKNDTIIISDTIIEGEQFQFAEFHYPSKVDYFASVKAYLQNGIGVGEWHFKPLGIDIIITEKENGMFNSYLDGPDWIEINDLQINTIKIEPQWPDKPYQFYLGGGVGYIEGFKFFTSGAVKWKNHMIQANLYGFSGVTLGYLRPL